MGTRSNTIFVSNRKQLVNVYRQCDGYLDGHGLELANFLNGLKLVNGLTGEPDVANSVPCLAAQFICKFKAESGAGGIYIDAPTNTPDNDFTYIVSGGIGDDIEPLPLKIDVFEYSTHIFSGSVAEFLEFCKSNGTAGEPLSTDQQKGFPQLVA